MSETFNERGEND